jgi:chromosome segregation ATPase
MPDSSTARPLLWAWVHSHFAKITGLREELQKIDKEYTTLLQMRQDLLAEIKTLEERVRPAVAIALASELPKWNG